ncbi:MAG: aminotransferase IV [Planctomycetes bacterium]|jgi:branched-chain amino acid aminotransferase|nr:aminotransferase IV [Planctomycetota bacterium]
MKQSFNPKNTDILINIDGELLRRQEAKISVFDSLVQGGDGCWEGLRAYQGRVFRLKEHLQRLFHSARSLGFESIPSEEHIRREIHRTLEANNMADDAHIRLTLSRGLKITSGMDPRLNQAGPTLIVLAEHKAPVYDRAGLKLITSSLRRSPPDCLDPKIHHNNLLPSILAKIEANAAGADDAVMLDVRGFVAETNATHLFLVSTETLKTSRTVACPEGVTRATVLELCQVHGIPHEVTDLSLVEFYRADEVFCTGTMGELAGVVEIDGRPIGGGEVGPMTRRLAELYVEVTRTESEVILT